MNIEHTKIIERKFNNDANNGALALGIIKLSELPKDFDFKPQDFYSFTIVLNNIIPLSDMLYQQPALKTGDVIQAFPKTYAGYMQELPIDLTNISPDTCVFYVRFGSQTFQALHSAGLLSPDPFFHFNLDNWATKWMEQLLDDLEKTKQEDLAEVYLNIQKFVVQIHRAVLATTERNRQLIESGKQLLFKHCLENFSLEEVSASLGLSYENFRKIFKEGTGMSPLQYTLDCKFHYAQRCLTDGLSVKETAEHVGYADPYIFSKQFKKYTGFSPSHYKKKD